MLKSEKCKLIIALTMSALLANGGISAESEDNTDIRKDSSTYSSYLIEEEARNAHTARFVATLMKISEKGDKISKSLKPIPLSWLLVQYNRQLDKLMNPQSIDLKADSFNKILEYFEAARFNNIKIRMAVNNINERQLDDLLWDYPDVIEDLDWTYVTTPVSYEENFDMDAKKKGSYETTQNWNDDEWDDDDWDDGITTKAHNTGLDKTKKDDSWDDDDWDDDWKEDRNENSHRIRDDKIGAAGVERHDGIRRGRYVIPVVGHDGWDDDGDRIHRARDERAGPRYRHDGRNDGIPRGRFVIPVIGHDGWDDDEDNRIRRSRDVRAGPPDREDDRNDGIRRARDDRAGPRDPRDDRYDGIRRLRDDRSAARNRDGRGYDDIRHIRDDRVGVRNDDRNDDARRVGEDRARARNGHDMLDNNMDVHPPAPPLLRRGAARGQYPLRRKDLDQNLGQEAQLVPKRNRFVSSSSETNLPAAANSRGLKQQAANVFIKGANVFEIQDDRGGSNHASWQITIAKNEANNNSQEPTPISSRSTKARALVKLFCQGNKAT